MCMCMCMYIYIIIYIMANSKLNHTKQPPIYVCCCVHNVHMATTNPTVVAVVTVIQLTHLGDTTLHRKLLGPICSCST